MQKEDRGASRRFDFLTLQMFVTVCDAGSIQRAAERKFIAASAVSKRIADLEVALNAHLLYRHARGVTPTAAGITLLHHARALLFKLDRMQSELSDYSVGIKGHVRLHANISAILQFLPEDISGFLRRSAGIRVGLEQQVSSHIIRNVQVGEADIGICNPQVNMSDLQRRPYREDHLVLAVPKHHPLAPMSGVRFSETLDEDHIGLPHDSALYLGMRRASAETGKAMKVRIHVNGLDAMCRMIINGLGVGVLPNRAFELLGAAGDLVAVPLLDEWANRTLYLVARDFENLPVAARLFAAHLLAGKSAATTNS
ncbi:LysR substrate-binding domain-containing protein [Ottowia thiooxydans]|uniref:LysR substrate-binding domain-containing protein n=1 Tax=Ottowia thiooxydans TaxID=219182 RepID=UPI00048F9C3E|nr:LysR substrate-binding domain-containing protein [Ottowia thiooxydans]